MSAPDTAHSAVVTSHPFEPRDPSQPWGLCKVCRLAESTHAETTLPLCAHGTSEGLSILPGGFFARRLEATRRDDGYCERCGVQLWLNGVCGACPRETSS